MIGLMNRMMSAISWPNSSAYALGIALGPPPQVVERPPVVAGHPQVPLVHRDEAAVEREDLQAVPGQVELPDDLRAEEGTT